MGQPQSNDSPLEGNVDFYSFFNKYSLMEEYGFASGVAQRVFRKILPVVPPTDSLEYRLTREKRTIESVLSRLSSDGSFRAQALHQLDVGLTALASKVTAYGMDRELKSRFDRLGLDTSPFETLGQVVHGFTTGTRPDSAALDRDMHAIEETVNELRRNKHQIGTTLHLTLLTRRLLEYTERIRQLASLRLHFDSMEHWQSFADDFVQYSREKDSLRRYITRHVDLVALQIVEHSASKGEKYIAESRREYGLFFCRALLGGSIIAVFAYAKLWLDALSLTDVSSGLVFGINYASCFIVVSAAGGIIATKQPAMTASTIAEMIETHQNESNTDPSIPLLVRRVFRSQFVSIAGNFLAAIFCACVIATLLNSADLTAWREVIKPESLIKKVTPTFSLMLFAAIAGVFLAFAGLVSGYVDNKVLALNVPYRIRNLNSRWGSEGVAKFTEKNAGLVTGNIALGLLLGTAFLGSYLLPFAVDIRHIAFSSANIGYAVVNQTFSTSTIAAAIAGALLIGLTNFLVSFSITLCIALKSRGAKLSGIPRLIASFVKDFFRKPLNYIYPFQDMQDDR